MIYDLYMLGFGVLEKILSDENSTCVVTENGDLQNYESIVKKLTLNPKNLSTTSTNGNVLRLVVEHDTYNCCLLDQLINLVPNN